MRLVDALLRQGHLSEQAIVEAIMTGERPAHLDRCDLCADRALEMGRWLDTVRAAAVEAADEAFPAERLAAQQAQIQRRIEQLDEPTRVIAFPGQARVSRAEGGRRLIAPAWLGVAAAAGLVIGAIGGQAAARLDGPAAAPVAQTPAAPAAQPPVETGPANALLLDLDSGQTSMPDLLGAMNEATPRIQGIQAMAYAR